MQLHERLDAVQKHFDLFDHAPTSSLGSRPENATQIDPLRFESTILDGVHVPTRAGIVRVFQCCSKFGRRRLRLRAADSVDLRQATGRRSQNHIIFERSLCRESPLTTALTLGKTTNSLLGRTLFDVQ